MAATDVLVIGGGIVGLVASSELAEAGARVTLVDAARNAGSTANAGSLHVQLQSRIMRLYPEQVPRIEAALPFYRKAVDHWENLERKVGPFGLVRKGGLMLADDEVQLAFLERKAERERRGGSMSRSSTAPRSTVRRPGSRRRSMGPSSAVTRACSTPSSPTRA